MMKRYHASACEQTAPISLLAGILLAALALPAAAADGPRYGVPLQLSETGRRAISPEIAIGPDGAINVIWLDKGLIANEPPPVARKPGEHSHRSSTDLMFRRSTDGGVSWSAPVRVNDVPGKVWGFAVSKPRIAIGPSRTIHVFFPANDKDPVTGFDVVTAQYTRSTDGGRSFEPARTVHRPGGIDQREMLGEGLAATYSFGTMGVAPDGTVHALWQDVARMKGNNDGANARATVSRDDGRTFSPEREVLTGSNVCPCCQLTVAYGGDQMYLGYRKLYGDGRDSTVARSADGGKSFSGETRLPFAPWAIEGCPLKITEMAVDGERVYAASYTAGEEPAGVYFSVSADGGRTFSGRRLLHAGAPYSDAPEMALARDGTLRIIWQAKTDGPRRLYLSESADGGANLSAPTMLAAPDDHNAANPATDIGADGTLFVAWEQGSEKVFVMGLAASRRVAAE